MARQTPSRRITEAARQEYLSSFNMLCAFVDVCPESVWESRYFGFAYPVWVQVFHTAYFVDYWFRDDYRGKPTLSMAFDNRIPPEFEHEPDPALMITKAEMQAYLALISAKVIRFFNRLNDAKLGMEIAENTTNHTYMEVVCCQKRHVMYNVGYLNAVLRSLHLEESDWYAYNETDE
jgi:hypothetical protein